MQEMTQMLIRSQNGDAKIREELIEKNLGLVRHIVKRYMGRGCDAEDLFQIGVIGLIKAVDHFDTSRELQFSTYAVPLILGEIKRFFRDDGMVKVSRGIKENAQLIKKKNEEFVKKNGRDPTILEIAELTGLSKEEIVMAVESCYEVESIYQPVFKNDGSEMYLVDKISDETDVPEEIANRIVLGEVLERMEQQERELIRLRYFENKTQVEVAGILGTTQVQISRREKKILLKMRAEMV